MSDNVTTATTRHQIYLQRVASHEALTFDDYLKEADRIIRDVLSRSEKMGTVKRLNAVTRELRKRLGDNYAAWTAALLSDLETLGGVESNFTAEMLRKATIETTISTPAVAAVYRAANVIPVQITPNGQSKPLLQFINEFSPAEVARVNGVVRNGFFTGATNADITRAIRGTKANNFRDGILDISRRSAAGIARTSVGHVANVARMRTMQDNSQVLSGWVFSATLDNRTTTICRRYDGDLFELGTGPMPPLHYACRSSMKPQVKPELSIFKQDGTRASVGAKGGGQTSKSPYYDWLQTQPKWFQRDVLGVKMTEVFRKGGLTNDQFRKLTTDNFGKPLTIQQMELRNPQAFELAA